MKLFTTALKTFKFTLISFLVTQLIATTAYSRLMGFAMIVNAIALGYEMFKLNNIEIDYE